MKNYLRPFLNRLGVKALIVLLFGSGIAHATTSIDRIVAIAGNEVITQSELDLIIRVKKEAGEAFDVKNDQWKILRQLIEEQLLIQEARKRGINITEDEIEFALKDIETRNQIPDRDTLKKAVSTDHIPWEEYVKNLRNQLMALKLLSREVNTMISLNDESIQEYYQKHKEIFGRPDRVKLTQILLLVPNDASEMALDRIKEKSEEIFSKARKGTDFHQLVQEYSEGLEKRDGGNLGFFKQGDLNEKIDTVIFSLNEGGITPPIQTALGIHIFKIEIQETGRMQTLKEVKQSIKERLIAEQTTDLRGKWIDNLWKRSYVEIK